MLFQPSDEPLDITLLLLPDSSLMSLAATLDPMRGANRIAGRALYRWRIVSPDGRAALTTSGVAIPVEGAFAPRQRQDLLIIIGAFRILDHATPALLGAVRQAVRSSGAVIGVEAGAWILALTGLLDGRRATTHWEDLEQFAQRFPEVEAMPDRWVLDGPFLTTGGAAPALDMMLAIIRARQGYATALDVASLYIYDEIRRPSDTQPAVSLGRIGSHEPRLADAIRIMEEHLDRPIAVAAIARRVHVSTRSLELMFRRSLAQSPGAYYLALRLKAARRLIADSGLSLADTAERTGFSSIATLSRAFKRQFGQPPSALRRATRRSG